MLFESLALCVDIGQVFLEGVASELYTVSLCCNVVARPVTSARSWAGARLSCPARTFWTVWGERGLSQKALVSRSWRGLGMVIWFEGMGSELKAVLTSLSVMMSCSSVKWPGSWTGSRAGEESIEKL